MTREGSGTAATGLTAKGSSPSPVQDRGCAHTSVRSEKVERMGSSNLKLSRYSIGTGDRFAHQAKAQLQACVNALESGIVVVPVWNKSNREHIIIGSEPCSVREAADAAVKALAWKQPYFLDADHITQETVGRFLPTCDFYTIDVADSIGQGAPGGGH